MRSVISDRKAGRTDVGLRHIQGKGTSFTRRAAQLDFTAEQVCQLAADRKTQTSAAIFAAGAGICLLESLKDDALFIERNTDSSIGNFEGDNRSGAIQNSVLVAPTVPYNRN